MKKNVLLLTAAFAALSVSAQVQEAKVGKGFKLVNPTAVKMAAPAMVKGSHCGSRRFSPHPRSRTGQSAVSWTLAWCYAI